MNGNSPGNTDKGRYQEFAEKNDAWDRKVRESLEKLSEAIRESDAPSAA